MPGAGRGGPHGSRVVTDQAHSTHRTRRSPAGSPPRARRAGQSTACRRSRARATRSSPGPPRAPDRTEAPGDRLSQDARILLWRRCGPPPVRRCTRLRAEEGRQHPDRHLPRIRRLRNGHSRHPVGASVAKRATRFVPKLASCPSPAHVDRTASPHPRPPANPGPVPGVDGLFLATGHEGLGTTLAPISGQLTAQAITWPAHHPPPHPFLTRPLRRRPPPRPFHRSTSRAGHGPTSALLTAARQRPWRK